MNKSNGNRTPSPDKKVSTGSDATSQSERRRISRIVHDDRGTASVEWRDVPDDFDIDRPVFTVEGTGIRKPIEIKQDDSFNPYDRVPDSSPVPDDTLGATRSGKRDLKKLSAWLKLMREMEERKKNGEDE